MTPGIKHLLDWTRRKRRPQNGAPRDRRLTSVKQTDHLHIDQHDLNSLTVVPRLPTVFSNFKVTAERPSAQFEQKIARQLEAGGSRVL